MSFIKQLIKSGIGMALFVSLFVVVSCSGDVNIPSTTPSRTTTDVLSGLTLEDVSAKTATINWDLFQESGSVDGSVTYVVVAFTTNALGEFSEVVSSNVGDLDIPLIVEGTKVVNFEIANLMEGLPYEIVVSAYDSVDFLLTASLDGSLVAKATSRLRVVPSGGNLGNSVGGVVATNVFGTTDVDVEWDAVDGAVSYVIVARESLGGFFGSVEIDEVIEVVCVDAVMCGEDVVTVNADGKFNSSLSGLEPGIVYNLIVTPLDFNDLVGIRSVNDSGEEISLESEIERLVSEDSGEGSLIRDKVQGAQSEDVVEVEIQMEIPQNVWELSVTSSGDTVRATWIHGVGAKSDKIELRKGGFLVESITNRRDVSQGGVGSVLFDGLDPTTEYEVIIISYAEAGATGLESIPVSKSIATLDAGAESEVAPPVGASDLILRNPEPGKLRVSWTTAEANSVLGYRVHYNQGEEVSKLPQYVARKGETDITFDVDPGEYNVRVDVIDGSEDGVVGGIASRKVYATPVAPSRILVDFNLPLPGGIEEEDSHKIYPSAYAFDFTRSSTTVFDAGGPIGDVVHYYRYKSSSGEWSDYLEAKEGDVLKMEARGDSVSAEYGKTYYLEVMASNYGGFMATGEASVVFQTFPEPIMGTDLNVVPGDKKLTISWPDSPNSQGSKVSSYLVMVTAVTGSNDPEVVIYAPKVTNAVVTEKSFVATGLENNVSYNIRVFPESPTSGSLLNALAKKFGYNPDGVKDQLTAPAQDVLETLVAYFGVLSPYVPQGSPDPVENLNVSGSDGVVVSWDKALAGSPAEGYVVEYIALNDTQAANFIDKTDDKTSENVDEYAELDWSDATTRSIVTNASDASRIYSVDIQVGDDVTNVFRVKAIRAGDLVSDYRYYAKGLFSVEVGIAGLPASDPYVFDGRTLTLTASISAQVGTAPVGFDGSKFEWRIIPENAGELTPAVDNGNTATLKVTNATAGSVAIEAAVKDFSAFKAQSNVALEKGDYPNGKDPWVYVVNAIEPGKSTSFQVNTDNAPDGGIKVSVSVSEPSKTAGTGNGSLKADINAQDQLVLDAGNALDGDDYTVEVTYVDANYVDSVKTYTVNVRAFTAEVSITGVTSIAYDGVTAHTFTATTAIGEGATPVGFDGSKFEWRVIPENAGELIPAIDNGNTATLKVTNADAGSVAIEAAVKDFSEYKTQSNVALEKVAFAVAPFDYSRDMLIKPNETVTLTPISFDVANAFVKTLTAKVKSSAENSISVGNFNETTGAFEITAIDTAKGGLDTVIEVVLESYNYISFTKEITVTLNQEPLAPTDGVAPESLFTDHTTTGFTFHWSSPTDPGKNSSGDAATVTNYRITWGEGDSLTNQIDVTSLIAGGRIFTGLNPGSRYSVTMVAMNDVGLSSTGFSGSTWTLSAPAEVNSLTSGTTTYESVVMNWAYTGSQGSDSEGKVATLADYRIQYKPSSDSDDGYADVGKSTEVIGVRLSDALTGSSTTATVTGLVPGNSYDFRIQVVNSIGLVSDWKSLTSVFTANLEAPSNLTSERTNSDSVSLKWDAVTGAGYYKIYRDDVEIVSSNAKTVYTNSDLAANMEYKFSVEACLRGSCSDASSVTLTTLVASPQNLVIATITVNSIDLSWNAVNGAEYYIVYRNSSGSPVPIATNTGTTHMAGDLIDETEYTFTVQACNSNGCSDFSGSVKAITLSLPTFFTIRYPSMASEVPAISEPVIASGKNCDLQTFHNEGKVSYSIGRSTSFYEPLILPVIDESTGVVTNYNGHAFAGTYRVTVTVADTPACNTNVLIYNTSTPTNVIRLSSEVYTGAMRHGDEGDLNYIDTSQITDMSRVLIYNGSFNADITKWDTSKVTNMSEMFYQASAFNQPIGNWNTSNVVRMDRMFRESSIFNQDISKWDTSKVANMSEMFYQASAFNQPIGNWNTSNVVRMDKMFREASTFNQDIGNWDTGKVVNMSDLFYRASAFNQPIGNWNTSNVTTMDDLFGATPFNQDISGWNTEKVTQMQWMFGTPDLYKDIVGLGAFNQDISSWNTSKVINMNNMFYRATAFNQDLSGWGVGQVSSHVNVFTWSGMEGQKAKYPDQSWDP